MKRSRTYGRRNITRYRSAPTQELKFYDHEHAVHTGDPDGNEWFSIGTLSNTIATGGILNPSGTLGIATGSGPSERIGRRIRIKSLHLKCQLIFDGEAGTYAACPVSEELRMMVLVDNQVNGVGLVPNDMEWLNNTGQNISKFRDVYNGARFTVLHDKVYTLRSTSSGTGTAHYRYPTNRLLNLNFSFGSGMMVTYDSNVSSDGKIASIIDRNIYVLFCNRQGHGRVLANTRLRFVDA